MPHRFELQIRVTDDGMPVLAVCGELDLAAAPQLRRVIGGPMGSGALVWAEHRLHAAGGELTAINPQPNVARAFEMAGLGPFVH